MKTRKQSRIRKVWLIKPFTKVKPSGRIYKRRKEKIDYEEAKDRVA